MTRLYLFSTSFTCVLIPVARVSYLGPSLKESLEDGIRFPAHHYVDLMMHDAFIWIFAGQWRWSLFARWLSLEVPNLGRSHDSITINITWTFREEKTSGTTHFTLCSGTSTPGFDKLDRKQDHKSKRDLPMQSTARPKNYWTVRCSSHQENTRLRDGTLKNNCWHSN